MSAPSAGPASRFTLRAVALLAAGAGAIALALLLRDVALEFLSVPLLAAVLAAYLAAPPAGVSARLSWTSSGAGRDVEVEGRFALSERLAPEGLFFDLAVPEPLVPQGAPVLERSPGALTVRQSYVAEYPCLAVLPRPDLVWRDPLGLVERPVPVEGEALRLERFPPEIARLRAAHLRRTTVYPGEVRSSRRGGAGDFFAIRPSAPHDTPRQINWRASARTGRWLANEYLLERTGDLLIVLDRRPTSLGPKRDAELLALGRAAAYGIAAAFLAEKARVGLATFGEFVDPVPLGTGRLQRYRLRRALQAVDVSPTAGPPERLAVSLSRYFPKGIGTLVISTLADEDAPLLLAHLRRRGYAPFVLAPSPLPLLADLGEGGDRRAQLAARLLRLARRQRLAAAWREAPIVDWEDYWSLAPFVRFLSRPPARTGGVG